MPKTVMVIAAHADDEALGCGGTIARHRADGDQVACLYMTNGVQARADQQPAEALCKEAENRRQAADKAAKALGISYCVNLDFPDNKMDSVALLDIVQAIEAQIREIRPEVIYTHYAHDLNIDHRLTFQAVLTACRPQTGHPVREIYSFEVPSSTEWSVRDIGPAFQPDMFVDVTEAYAAKKQALEAYAEEMRPAPHPRSYEGVEALASWRGHSAGVRYAEAFQTVRIIK